MKAVNIRSLKHDTSSVMKRVSLGESVRVTNRNRTVAVISPAQREMSGAKVKGDESGTGTGIACRTDFRMHHQQVFGEKLLDQTGTEIVSDSRGEY